MEGLPLGSLCHSQRAGRETNGKSAADAGDAVDMQCGPMPGQHMLDDCQAQPGPPGFS